MEFFSIFYQNNLYGQDLFYHLKGWNGFEFVAENNQFPLIWLITFGAAAVFFVLYYYILNHPRFNRFWHWLITFAILAVVIFFYSRSLVMSDLLGASAHPIDPSLNIAANNATMFGVYNGVLAGVFFFVLSIIGRFGSKNAKNSPFNSLINRK